jgi:3-hydroxyisobutyrate dehydrogenase-like beta-hydroxyacid dehydrogenase
MTRPATRSVEPAPAAGVVGLGVMGCAIARRLLHRLGAVHVTDLRPQARDELEADGATAHADAAGVAAASEIVLLSLNTAAIVERAVFGDGGVVDGAREGLLIVDMSSIDPNSARDFARRAHERGLRWVDAPLSGGAPGAAAGTLSLMLGGTEADVARARSVLDHLATAVTHLGDHGAGQLVKLLNQIVVGCEFAAIAECAALSRAAGLDPTVVSAALQGGRADSAVLREFFVKFATLDLTPTGRVSNMVKDLETAREYARSAGVPLPATTTASELHRWLQAHGHGDADNAALMHYYVNGSSA